MYLIGHVEDCAIFEQNIEVLQSLDGILALGQELVLLELLNQFGST